MIVLSGWCFLLLIWYRLRKTRRTSMNMIFKVERVTSWWNSSLKLFVENCKRMELEMGTIGLVCCPSYCVDLFINKHFNISRLGRTARKDCIFSRTLQRWTWRLRRKKTSPVRSARCSQLRHGWFESFNNVMLSMSLPHRTTLQGWCKVFYGGQPQAACSP